MEERELTTTGKGVYDVKWIVTENHSRQLTAEQVAAIHGLSVLELQALTWEQLVELDWENNLAKLGDDDGFESLRRDDIEVG